MKLLATLAAAAALQLTPPYTAADETPPAADNAPPDATLQVHGGSFALGVGLIWGKGTLTYQGTDHNFIISGVSIGDLGGAKFTATGPVSHIANLSDFEGSYVAWGMGATIGSGGSAVYMKNQHGVLIKLVTHASGLRLRVSGNGVKIKFERQSPGFYSGACLSNDRRSEGDPQRADSCDRFPRIAGTM
jgi:hypothetical protein